MDFKELENQDLEIQKKNVLKSIESFIKQDDFKNWMNLQKELEN